MRFGDLRAGRTPLHLPFRDRVLFEALPSRSTVNSRSCRFWMHQEPFRSLPLLGQDESLRDVLTEYLGEDFELLSLDVDVEKAVGGRNSHGNFCAIMIRYNKHGLVQNLYYSKL